jgi:putative heme iron utilization protein
MSPARLIFCSCVFLNHHHCCDDKRCLTLVQASSKTKDAQLKRATETIARLRQQLQETETNLSVSTAVLCVCA